MKETKRRPRLRWLDNIDRHHKGKNTSLKEVLRKECFKNRKNWRTLISRSTDRNSGEDPSSATWSVVSSEHHSPLLQIIIQCTMQEYILLRTYIYGSAAGVLEPTATSWFLDSGFATGSSPPRKSTVAYFTPNHQPFTNIRYDLVFLSCQPRPWIY